jgi:hypothetical protein
LRKFKKKSVIELVAVVEGGYLVQNEGLGFDRWVIPKDVFEATYEEIKC